MRCFKIALVFLSFSLELRVQAQLLELPSGCLTHEAHAEACTLKNNSDKSILLKLSNNEIYFTPQSLLILESSKIDLVKGQILIRSLNPNKVESEFGQLSLSVGDQLIVVKTNNEQKIYTIEGNPKFKALQKEVSLFPSFEYSFGLVNSRGQQKIKLPQLADKQAVANLWQNITGLQQDELRSVLKKYNLAWDEQFKAVDRLHNEEVQREIASFKASEVRRKKVQAKEDQEDAVLLRLFKSRHNLHK